MDREEVEVVIRDLEEITRELDEVQREITRDIVSRITSIQNLIGQEPQREVILEKAVARVTIRENGQTLFEGLF
jgi:hypothetical protein